MGPLRRPAAALWPVPSQGGKMGGRKGEGEQICVFTRCLPVRGLGVRNSFVQPSPSLCPSSCSSLSHCWGFVLAQGGEGSGHRAGGKLGGGDYTTLQLGSEKRGPASPLGKGVCDRV